MMPFQPPQGEPIPQQPPQQEPAKKPVTIDAVMELLRDGIQRRFRIDIETDSTVAGDEGQERQDRTEFIMATTKFIEAWGPIVAQQPLMTQLAGELLLFGTRAFRVGRSLEEVIEETVDKLEMQAAQPKPPPEPSPDEKVKLETAKVKGQAEIEKVQTEGQIAQMEAQFQQQQTAMEAQFEQQRMAMEAQAQKMDMLLKIVEHQQSVKENQLNAEQSDRDHEHAKEIADHKAKEAMKPKDDK